MIKKTATYLKRGLLLLLALLVLTGALVLGRLMIAPVDITFAKDIIRGQTVTYLPGWQVDFDKAMIIWDWENDQLTFGIDGLFLIDRKDRLRADFKTTRINITKSVLYSGRAKLVNITSSDAVVSVTDLAGFTDDETTTPVVKEANADFSFLTPASMKPLTEGLTRFTRRLIKGQTDLNEFTFSNFHVLISAGNGKAPVNLHLVEATMKNVDGIINFSARGETDIGDVPAAVTLSGKMDSIEGVMAVNVDMNDLSIQKFATSFGMPAMLQAMDFPVSVEAEMVSTATLGLTEALINLDIGAGVVSHPYHFPLNGKINSGRIALDFYPLEKQLKIKEGTVILDHKGEMTLDLDGLVYWQENKNRPGFDINVVASSATIDHVAAFWPVVKSKLYNKPMGGRTWVVDNIQSLNAENIKFDFVRTPDGIGPFKDGSPLQLTFEGRDVMVKFLQDMPAMKKAKVTATMTQFDLDMKITEGMVNSLPFAGSEIYIDWSHRKYPSAQGKFKIKTKGEVSDIIDLLSAKPVDLHKKIQIDSNRLGGVADVTTTLELPLLNVIPLEKVNLLAQASISQARLDTILDGEGLRDGDLAMTVSLDQVYVEGKGRINGVPLSFSWIEDLKATQKGSNVFSTRVVLAGDIEARDLAAFGIPEMDFYSEGKMPAEGTFLGHAFNFKEGYFSADATPATLKFDILAWEKQVGTAANINGALQIEDDQLILKPLTILGDNIDVTIAATWDRRRPLSDGTLPFEATVTAAKLDNNQLTATVSSDKVNHMTVGISGKQLDLQDLLSGRRASSLGESQDRSILSMDVDLKMDRVLMKNAVTFTNFETTLKMVQGDPEEMRLSAIDKDGYTLSGQISPRKTAGKGKRKREMNPLTLSTENGGELLRGLGVFAHGFQGKVDFNGEIMGWQGSDFHVAGDFQMKDMKVVRASALDATVTEGILDGINEFVDEKGLKMKKASGRFVFKDTILDISNFKANSSNLGITLQGQYEDVTRRINMNGVVVPAYGLNSFLGKIPLVGPILTGGKGKGLFGITYRLKGQGSGAKFSVNPLSAVTPGFLRNIFEGEKGKVKNVKITDPDPVNTAQEDSEENSDKKSDKKPEKKSPRR